MSDTQDVQFVCTACEKQFQGNKDDVMTECRVCHRIHCHDCVDEYGRCVQCAENPPDKS